jgi:hypothetical protein
MNDNMKKYPTIKYREPSKKALLTALSGAIVVLTPDGNNVVLAPETAREIGKHLTNMANLADGLENPPQTLRHAEVVM